jgi:hypothetical protein
MKLIPKQGNIKKPLGQFHHWEKEKEKKKKERKTYTPVSLPINMEA